MQRIACLIRVRPEKLKEYLKLHDPIWPELAAELTASGIRNYSLWCAPNAMQFGYLECDDWQAACDYLAESEVHTRWQALMKDYLFTPADNALGGQPFQMLQPYFLLE